MCADSQTSPGQWTRREFVRGAAALVTAPHLAPALSGSKQFAYVGSGDDSLRVFSVQSGRWTQIQCVTSLAPACILVSPHHNMLYVANALSVHERLPRGTIETFHIDADDGRLTLAGHTALSLSATEPRHMAISGDGKLLAVAAYGGGVYNLLPVASDGTPGSVQSIFKDTGCGAHAQLQTSAHPHTLIFDCTGGRLLSSDFGADRLSVFSVEDGRLQRTTQRTTGEASGPSACLLHPTAGVLYAWHALQSTLASYRYDGASIGQEMQRFSLPAHAQGSLALHPSGRALYSAQATLRAWQVDGEGKLSLKREISVGETKQVVAAPDGESVYTLGGASGSVCAFRTDRDTGELKGQTRVAVVNQPGSLVFKTIS
jgi:6-phosphogluconolactonase